MRRHNGNRHNKIEKDMRAERAESERMRSVPKGPPASMRVHADPVVALMALDEWRVREMRSTWREDYAK